MGVGGSGGRTINNMIRSRLGGVEFMSVDTDPQELRGSQAERRILLSGKVAQGFGFGSGPDIGRAAAKVNIGDILGQIGCAGMLFITAGMGGGTGTGVAPVIAKAAREQGMLTVGLVTTPLLLEGAHRMRTAEAGIDELSQYVDALIIIPNKTICHIATECATLTGSFKRTDDAIFSGVRSIIDMIAMPGSVNIGFEDIGTVLRGAGRTMIGTTEAWGATRAIDAAEAAIYRPLTEITSMKGTKAVLIHIIGDDMSLFEIDAVANRIRDEADPGANIIFSATQDRKLNGALRVSVIATGFPS